MIWENDPDCIKQVSGSQYLTTQDQVIWDPNDVKRGLFSVKLLEHIWGHGAKYGTKLKADGKILKCLKNIIDSFQFIVSCYARLTGILSCACVDSRA